MFSSFGSFVRAVRSLYQVEDTRVNFSGYPQIRARSSTRSAGPYARIVIERAFFCQSEPDGFQGGIEVGLLIFTL